MRSIYRCAVFLAVASLALSWPLVAQDGADADWRDFPIRDALTGETVRISDFEGTTVLLESFAVWCPTCTRQQQEIRKLHEAVGGDVVSISLDVDPNETEAMVRQHAASNGFDWIYAVAPPELTRALMREFGTAIVAAPSAPVVLICEDQSDARLLGRGVKRANRLIEEIERGCGG